MGTVTATTLVLLVLCVIVGLPRLLSFGPLRLGTLALPVYAVALVGLGLYHLGGWERGATAATVDITSQAEVPDANNSSLLCGQALARAEQGGIVLSRSDDRVTVNRFLWAQLPAQIREGMIQCMQPTSRPGAPRAAFEVIEADPRTK